MTPEGPQALVLAEQAHRQNPSKPEHPPKPEVRQNTKSGPIQSARRFRRWLDITTLTLASLGILFAIWQAWDSQHLRDDTQTLLNYATTTYVAEFPGNLPWITNLVKNTCERLDILVDVPGYGMYSNPENYFDYEEALRQIAHEKIEQNVTQKHCTGKSIQGSGFVNVRLLVWNPMDQHEQSIRKQFNEKPGPTGTQNWRTKLLDEKSVERRKFLNFVDNNRDAFKDSLKDRSREAELAFLQGVATTTVAYNAFIKGLESEHADVEKKLHAAGTRVEIRYAKLPVIYMRMWLQDSADSIFSFDHTPTDGDETEIAFQSHDPHLLTTFEGMFEQHWQDAICYDDYWRLTSTNPNATLDQVRQLPACTTDN